MPSLHEVTLLKVYFCVSKDSFNQFSEDVMSLNDFYLHRSWSWQVEREFIANIVLRIRFVFFVSFILHGNCLVRIGEPKECGRFHIITGNQ
jgi:hypothetical protein